MNTLAKIVILCGGKLAFPAIQTLALHGHLAGIAIGGEPSDAGTMLQRECQKSGLPFIACSSKNDLDNLQIWLNGIVTDAVFCICFPYKLPADMLQTPSLKFINFHTGPLPQYRGPMPIFEVLRNQETATALSLHFMEAAYDTGPIIFKEPIAIGTMETFGSLAVKMSLSAGQSALNMAQMLTFGSSVPCQPQAQEEAQYYAKPERRDTLIRWEQMQASEIVALINACNPWHGGADTMINGHALKIIAVSMREQQHEKAAGTIMDFDVQTGIKVACIEDHILFVEIVSTDLGITAGHLVKNLGITTGQQFS